MFATFKKWKYLAENEIGKRLKCIRPNNGGEYVRVHRVLPKARTPRIAASHKQITDQSLEEFWGLKWAS